MKILRKINNLIVKYLKLFSLVNINGRNNFMSTNKETFEIL